MSAMTAILEQVVSKKLGVALAAMFIISQMTPEGSLTTQLLIAGLAALHLVCQTILDLRMPGKQNGSPETVISVTEK